MPQVMLTAAGSSKVSNKVLLKQAAGAGVSGGANMIQTIFSDYAPTGFPFAAVSKTLAEATLVTTLV